MLQHLTTVFDQGGVFMYVILAFFLATMCFITERFYGLYLKLKPVNDQEVEIVRSAIQKGNLKDAFSTVSKNLSHPVNRVIQRGIEVRNLGLSDEELRSRMDESLSEEISLIDRRTGFLAMFGNVATLVGLLGTISGMIKSFAAVASANPIERSALLSKGISEAMNCTAFGLLVAIPALVCYAIFQNKTEKTVASVTDASAKVFHDLLFRVESVISPTYGKRSREIQNIQLEQ